MCNKIFACTFLVISLILGVVALPVALWQLGCHFSKVGHTRDIHGHERTIFDIRCPPSPALDFLNIGCMCAAVPLPVGVVVSFMYLCVYHRTY
jgi:hypothetical protein